MKIKWPAILVAILIGSTALAGFHAAVLGDRTGTADQAVFQGIVDNIEMLHPDVVFCVGDLIEGPQPDADAINQQWDIVGSSLDTFTMPFYYVPGNNDIFDDTSRRLYSQRTGIKPYYSTDVHGVHVIVLDNSQARNVEEMGEAQLEWLQKDLANHTGAPLTFVFFHKPFWYDAFEADKPDKLHNWFKKYGVDWVFSGHYHRYASTEKDGIHYVMVGSSGGHVGNNPDRGEFYHFGWMQVDGEEVNFSVIKADAVQPKDTVTLDKVKIQEHIESERVHLAGVTADPAGNVQGTVTLTVGNNWDRSLDGKCHWDVPDNWFVTPEQRLFTMDPGGLLELAFDCAMNGRSLYPLPEVVIDYPWNDGSRYTIRRSLKVMRMLSPGRADSAPDMDGIANDPCWTNAVVIEDFGDGDGGTSQAEPVSARMIVVGNALYLHIDAVESRPESMLLPSSERDGPVFRGDCVYIMLWSGAKPAQVTQFIISPAGTVNDGHGTIEAGAQTRPNMDRKWNAGIETAAADTATGWALEIRIPFEDIAITKQPDRLGFNMFRLQNRLGAFAVWQEPATFDPGDAARLILPSPLR